MKVKKLLILIILTTVVSSVYSHEEHHANEQPMYGNIAKTEKMKESDKQFIEDVIKTAGSREKGLEYFLDKAWEALYSGDMETSMKRFNQCWLLDDSEPDVYWGFGILLGAESDYKGSIEMLEKALELDKENYRLMVDLAYSYTLYSQANNLPTNNTKLIKALELYVSAEKYSDPFFALYNNWASTLSYQDKYQEALEKLLQAEKLGFKPDEEFITYLKSQINNNKK